VPTTHLPAGKQPRPVAQNPACPPDVLEEIFGRFVTKAETDGWLTVNEFGEIPNDGNVDCIDVAAALGMNPALPKDKRQAARRFAIDKGDWDEEDFEDD
jgi:hypothetical protein